MDTKQSSWFAVAALAVTVLVSLPLVAGFFGWVHPAFDSMGHFRVHLAIVLILCAVPLLMAAMRRQALAAVCLGLAAITTVHSGFVQVQAAFEPRDANSPVYRLLQMNLRFDNAEPEKVLSMIGRLHPDVITLEEVSKMWVGKLDLLKSAYPYRTDCNGSFPVGGTVILSTRPVTDARCLDYITLTAATVDFGGRPVTIAGIHLPWPWPSDQRDHVDALRPEFAAMSGPTIVAGDFNSTPWSETARIVASSGSLKPVPVAGATWQYRLLPDALRFAGLPLDQVFAKGGVIIHSAATLPPAGSDHLPILVEFSLKALPSRPEQAVSTTVSIAAPTAPRG